MCREGFFKCFVTMEGDSLENSVTEARKSILYSRKLDQWTIPLKEV